MKYIAIILFLLIGYSASAQSGWNRNDTSKYVWYKYQYGQRMPRSMWDSVLTPPKDTIFSKDGIVVKGTIVYAGNGTYWTAASGGGGGGTFQTVTDAGNTTTNNFQLIDGAGNPLVAASNATGVGTLTVTDSITAQSAALTHQFLRFVQGGSSVKLQVQNSIGGTYILRLPNKTDTLATLSDIPSGYYDNATGIYYDPADSTVRIDTGRANRSIVNWYGLRDTLSGIGGGGTNGLYEVTAINDTTNKIALPFTTSSTVGVINVGQSRYFHNYTDPGIVSDGYNVFLGRRAGNFTMGPSGGGGVLGGRNVGIGDSALARNTTGWQNTAIGHISQARTTTGFYNTSLGAYSLASNTTGNNNSMYGADAGWKNFDGENNTGVGSYALQQNISGDDNTVVGAEAMENAVNMNNSVAVGSRALRATTGSNNTAAGYHSMELNTSGSQNTAYGAQSLNTNLIGVQNTGIGYGALQTSKADNNTAVGHSAGDDISTGSQNVAVGSAALGNTSTSSNNTALGYQAGLTNTTGAGNTFIGKAADALVNNLSNVTVIGSNAKGWVSNTLILGDTINSVKVGIGVNNPDSTLHVVGGLKFDLPSKGAGKVLTSSATGAATWETPSGGSGVTTMAAIGAVPNANGASISGSTLTLQPADGSFGGVVTTGAQTFAGVKTLTSPIFITPALGTPASGVVTNLTGTASININGTVGATTPTTIAGTSLVLSSFLNEAKGADIASATTTDIGAMTGNYGDVTGTTTITGLGTVQAGTKRIVRFTGALTLTHNATSLILPGGVNRTTVAGDVAEFVSLGSGNWRCTYYTPITVTGTGSTVLSSLPTFPAGITVSAGTATFSGLVNVGSAGIRVPNIEGGSANSSSLNLYSTSGVGTTDFIRGLVGNAGATESFRAISNGNFGTGVTAPTSRLHTTSFATGYTAQTSTYSILASDHTVNCTSGTFTATLPTAVGCTGRIYVITNSGAGTITIATTSSQTFTNVVATPTTLSMATVGSRTVQSDGANWLLISSL